jgi:hexokinase
MSMGKGFAITSNLDLAEQLRNGYSKAAAGRPIPPLKIVAIINDTVATLISFAYQLRSNSHSKAAMGLICGTGNNATIPLKMSSLHPSKRYDVSSIGTISPCTTEPRILINTEWSISGTAPPLHDLSLITNWDSILDAGTVIPGFMPFEYMTAGGYLGELGRIIVLDFLTTQLHIPEHTLPVKVRTPQGLSTTFLGHFRMSSGPEVLNDELPADENDPAAWQWTSEAAFAVGKIARAIQRRAAGMTAAAIIGLLICAEEIHLGPNSSSSSSSDTAPSAERDYTLHHPSSSPEIEELIVGYTGGCITHFRDYLQDCQAFLDAVIEDRFGAVENGKRLRVVLQECHDGGIVGAGVLAGSVQSLARRERD